MIVQAYIHHLIPLLLRQEIGSFTLQSETNAFRSKFTIHSRTVASTKWQEVICTKSSPPLAPMLLLTQQSQLRGPFPQ